MASEKIVGLRGSLLEDLWDSVAADSTAYVRLVSDVLMASIVGEIFLRLPAKY